MRLISFSANQSSFKKVEFNPQGPSFILAKQDKPEENDNNKTYNGVGKSLLIALLHFCLGAKSSGKLAKSLKVKLPDWEFTLDVEIKDQKYSISRSAKYPDEISLNGEDMKVTEFHQKMKDLCFTIPNDVAFLTFRSLLPFFLRPSKSAYVAYDQHAKVGVPYQKQLYNAFLLGLSVHLADKKYQIRTKLVGISNLLSELKKDSILKSFLEGSQDSTITLVELKLRITKLEKDIKQYEVADDYYEIKEKADELKDKIDEAQNQIHLKKINIKSIDKSLQINPDIERDDIQKIYNESQRVFQNEVRKNLQALEKFYDDLVTKRKKRLLAQKQVIDEKLDVLMKQQNQYKKDFDESMKFLDAHQALDIFTQTHNKLYDLKQQASKLENYQEFKKKCDSEITELKAQLLEQDRKTIAYLADHTEIIDSILFFFNELAKRFYPQALAGITVENNNGTNQIRYDIEAKIQSDLSDGINSVKLFCYDLTIFFLQQGHTHNMNFIFHDSRLFSDIDETHCNELFSIAEEKFTTNQYIASINQNQLHSLQETTQTFIRNHTILVLTDDSDSGKLLGITVELEYD